MKRSRKEAKVKRDVKVALRGKRRKKRSRSEAKAVDMMTPSNGHLCFAGYSQSKDRYGMLTRLEYDDVTSDDFEVFVGPKGFEFYKAPMKLGLEDDERLGRVRKGRVCVLTGAWQILELCKMNGFPAPAATTALIAERNRKMEALRRVEVQRQKRIQEERSKAKKEPTMYGRNGKSLGQTWSELLIGNEKDQLTDDQLKQKVYESFPDSQGRSTIERVGMIRNDFNAGRGLFKKFGPAGKRGRPRSVSYGKPKRSRKSAAARQKRRDEKAT